MVVKARTAGNALILLLGAAVFLNYVDRGAVGRADRRGERVVDHQPVAVGEGGKRREEQEGEEEALRKPHPAAY